MLKKIFLTSIMILTALNVNAKLTLDEMKQLQNSAINKNNHISQYVFGIELIKSGVEDKGVEILKHSAKNKNAGNGYEPAQRYLGEYYIDKKKYNIAAIWLKESVKNGNFKSAYIISAMYRLGLINDNKDFEKSYAWMEYAAKKGNISEAWEDLAKMKMIGFGTEKNEDESVNYFQKAIKDNNYKSMLLLGMYYKINGINDSKANELISKVVKNQNNFVANYVYKKNVIGDLTEITMFDNINDKELRNKKKKEESLKMINKTHEIDQKLKDYYNQMMYTFPTIEQSIKI